MGKNSERAHKEMTCILLGFPAQKKYPGGGHYGWPRYIFSNLMLMVEKKEFSRRRLNNCLKGGGMQKRILIALVYSCDGRSLGVENIYEYELLGVKKK